MNTREAVNRLLRALKMRDAVEIPRAELSGLSPEIAALADPSKQEIAELGSKFNRLAEVVENLTNIEIPDEVSEDEGDDRRIELLEQQMYLLTEQVALLLPEEEEEGGEPWIAHDRGRVRVGKIDSHSGSGVYVVTQQEWSGSAWQAVPSDHPMYQVSCRDLRARTTGSAADVVTLWQQLDSSGELEVVCNILPADTNTDDKVKASSADPGGTDHLDQQVRGDDTWTEITTVDAAAPDFRGFVKADPDGVITRTSGTVTVASITKDQDTWLYDDYGAGYFTDELVHRFKTECTAAGPSSLWYFWALSNVIEDGKYWTDNASEAVTLFWYTSTGQIWLYDREHASGDSCTTVAIGTPYWIEVSRAGTTTITVNIYEDDAGGSEPGTAKDTITTTLDAGQAYQFLFATNSQNVSDATAMSGYTEQWSLAASDDDQVKVAHIGPGPVHGDSALIDPGCNLINVRWDEVGHIVEVELDVVGWFDLDGNAV